MLRRRLLPASALVLASLCLSTGWLTGCARGGGSDARADLSKIPEPVLDAVEPSVRRQIETAEADLRAVIDDPGADDAELAESFGDLGRTYHAYQFLEAAGAAYSNARRLAPDSFQWTYLQALVHEERGDKEGAVESLSAALRLRPGDLPARVRRAALYKDLGQRDLAREELEKALTKREDLALAHYYLAQMDTDSGDWQTAARRYERVLELQPGASRVRYPLSRVYQRLGRTDEAARQAQRTGADDVTMDDPLMGEVLRLKQGAAALVRRGAAAQIDGDWHAAQAAYREAVDADPASVEARMSLGGALAQTGDLRGAEEQLRKAVDLDPAQALAWYNLAGVLRSQGRLDAALDAYAEALRLSPYESKFLLARAQTQLDAGRPDAAGAIYESVLEIEPDSVDASFGLAVLHAAQGRVAEARRRLEALLGRDLTDSQRRRAQLRLANLRARSGDAAGALDLYESVAAASAEDSPSDRAHLMEAHFGRANLLGSAGRFGEAARAYQTVTSLDPRRTDAWLGGATALVLNGDWLGARRRLNEGLRATDNDMDLQHTLARLLATAPVPEARDGEQALRLARAALDQGGSVDFAETVGMALAELGRWQEAVDWQQSVIDQLQAAGQTERAAAAQALRDQYLQHRPVRQGAPS